MSLFLKAFIVISTNSSDVQYNTQNSMVKASILAVYDNWKINIYAFMMASLY